MTQHKIHAQPRFSTTQDGKLDLAHMVLLDNATEQVEFDRELLAIATLDEVKDDKSELRSMLHTVLPSDIVAELTASPFALRAGLLGLKRGLTMSYHERRLRMPPAAHLQPDAEVWQHGHEPTVWQDGVLNEPKYYSFFLDGPIPAYNPNYRGKWRSHELLHGAVGFFWHPQQSRFDAYLGARLAELLPVVHWYALDEILRTRCPEHAHYNDPPLQECPRCEAVASARPYWENDWSDAHLPRTMDLLSQSLEHFSLEWHSCVQEFQQGKITPALYKNLNASSDALGYVRSHWKRLTAHTFGQWIDMFMRPGKDYFDSMDSYMDQVLSVANSLYGGEIALSQQEIIVGQERRAIQDLGYRALYLMEYVAEDPNTYRLVEAQLMPFIQLLGQEALRDTPDREQVDICIKQLQASLSMLSSSLPEHLTDMVCAVGHDVLNVQSAQSAARELQQVIEGVESAAPTFIYALAGAQVDAGHFLEGFLTDPHFARRGPLLDRLASYMSDVRGEFDYAEVVRLEAMLVAWPRHDEHAATLSKDAVDLEDALAHPERLSVNKSVKYGRFRAAILEAVLEQDFGQDPEQEFILLRMIDAQGELVIQLCDDMTVHILDDLRAEGDLSDRIPTWGHEQLAQLLQEGVVWCLDV